MKKYKSDIRFFYNKIYNNEKFALAKFGDGEWAAIQGNKLSAAKGEWTLNPEDSSHLIAQKKLIDSIKYKDINYYVAICPCSEKAREFSKQNNYQITYANIFVGANYEFYKKKYIEIYKKKQIHFIGNKKINLDNLPFKIQKFYPIDFNAWVLNSNLSEYILEQDPKDKVFLIAAGAFACILTHELWSKNKNNTYIDIGSTLDPWTKTELLKRDYYMGDNEFSRMTCPCPTYYKNILKRPIRKIYNFLANKFF